MSVFQAADILLPYGEYMENWPVVACDQFSSQPEYWDRVQARVNDSPSTLSLILPEAWLGQPKADEHQDRIPETMERYLEENILKEYPDAMIYVERELRNHKTRRGLVGALDLEEYSYLNEDVPVRATEKTILERIPPRAAIRSQASLELPHVLLLADDKDDLLLSQLTKDKETFTVLYDLDLMEEGGHLTGWLVDEPHKEAFYNRLHEFEEVLKERYADLQQTKLLFAVGDGNHSLAAAKALWEQIKSGLSEEQQQTHPARYALCELGSIHDDSLEFEPIHRIVTDCSTLDLLHYIAKNYGTENPENGYPVRFYTSHGSGPVYLDKQYGQMAVAILQQALDEFLETHPGKVDYIHGSDVLKSLSEADNAVGFLLPPVSKDSLFRQVIQAGSLPRKTFSMGHASEKRYYMEARKIK